MISTEEFHKACKSGDIVVIQQYISEGGDVNVADKAGWTGLMWAAYKGDPQCVRELISAGADVNFKRHVGKTALMSAVEYGNIDSVHELILAGADVNIQDINGNTALIKAAYNILPGATRSILMKFMYKINIAMAEMLIEAGADIYHKNNEGDTAIDCCKDNEAKAGLIQTYQKRLNIETAIKSSEKPILIKGFDSEL